MRPWWFFPPSLCDQHSIEGRGGGKEWGGPPLVRGLQVRPAENDSRRLLPKGRIQNGKYTHLEMPPRPGAVLVSERIRHADEFGRRQIRRAEMVHDGAAPRRLAPEDVRARRLCLVLAVDAVIQVDQSPSLLSSSSSSPAASSSSSVVPLRCAAVVIIIVVVVGVFIKGRQDSCRVCGVSARQRRDEVQAQPPGMISSLSLLLLLLLLFLFFRSRWARQTRRGRRGRPPRRAAAYELLQDLERVAAVAAASHREARGAEFGVFLGKVRDAFDLCVF